MITGGASGIGGAVGEVVLAGGATATSDVVDVVSGEVVVVTSGAVVVVTSGVVVVVGSSQTST